MYLPLVTCRRFLFKDTNHLLPIMITRSPLSPYFNPYNKDTLEVFPDKQSPLLFAFATYFSIYYPNKSLTTCTFIILRCDKRNLYICHYIISLNLKLYIRPNLGERSIIYKVSFCTINGFLAPSSGGMLD